MGAILELRTEGRGIERFTSEPNLDRAEVAAENGLIASEGALGEIHDRIGTTWPSSSRSPHGLLWYAG